MNNTSSSFRPPLSLSLCFSLFHIYVCVCVVNIIILKYFKEIDRKVNFVVSL